MEDKAIATEFFFTLEDSMSDEEFREASKMVKRSSRYFPTIAQLFEMHGPAIEALRRKGPGNCKEIAGPEYDDLTDEGREQSAKMYGKMVELAGSGLSHEEMAQKMEEFRLTI